MRVSVKKNPTDRKNMREISLNIGLIILVLHLPAAVHGVDQYSRTDFPADFVFGSGTSAYQYEGAAFEDGRSPSIWDTFAHSGHTNGANGDIACDGYHKYKDDIQLMVDTNLEAFRFSISWSRLIPNGRGPINQKGLHYYNNLIDELISYGIQPHMTLNHIDLPQALEDEYGGWLSRKIVKDFTAFADVCFREFGDRVLHWTTVNEANIFAVGGYDQGIIAPGRCSARPRCSLGNSSVETYMVGHNILLAHSAVVRLYRAKYKAIQKGYMGFNIYTLWFEPYTNATEDFIATQRANDFFIGWLINPLIFGDYPETVKKNAQNRIPTFTKLQSEQIKGSVDFIGVNHYTTAFVKDNPNIPETDNSGFSADLAAQIIEQQGDTPQDQYPVLPSGLYGVLEYLKQVYGNLPVYIHENACGISQHKDCPLRRGFCPTGGTKDHPTNLINLRVRISGDAPVNWDKNSFTGVNHCVTGQMTRRNGTLNDTPRVEYLHAFIGSMLDALRNGSNVKGYFAWSFLDCLELLDGYGASFGFYYVDLDDTDLKRYQKLSARWYANFLKGKTSSNSIIEVGKGTSVPLRYQFSQ